ncbi:MAG TPA: OstA-like protein, partial [Flavobacteriales bacterium]|nr:OstA-like protein [Flavobacteriales bacterium]
MRSLFIWVLILLHAGLLAQSPPPAGARIEILSADNLVYDKAFTKAQRLLGHVRLKHENALMRCDSAWLFEDQTMNAFGHVAIDHDTLHITGERLD